MIRHFSLLAILTTQCINPCFAAKVSSELLDYGLVTILHRGQATSNSEAVTGETYYNAATKIEQTTNKIALQQGIAFGINWCVYNLADGNHNYRTDYIYQPFHSSDRRFMAKDSIQFNSSHGVACNEDAYELTESYELLAGFWTIKSTMDNGVEVIKTFIIKEQ